MMNIANLEEIMYDVVFSKRNLYILQTTEIVMACFGVNTFIHSQTSTAAP